MPANLGIKIKLTIVLSAVIAVAACAVGVILIAHERTSLETQMRTMAATLTDEFAMDAKIPLLSRDRLGLSTIVQNILQYPGIDDAYILNHNFVIEAHKHKEELGLVYEDREAVADAVLKAGGLGPWLVREDSEHVTFVSSIIFQKTTVGYSVITFSTAFIKEKFNQAIGRLALIAVLVLVAAALVSFPLASRLISPILTLLKGTKEIALGNLDFRIPHIRRDEIGALIESFNNMASELKKKEILKGAFSRYVNPYIAEEIMRTPGSVRLGGQRSELTVFFADIRGFTELSRLRPPEEVVEVLNLYFTLITEVVFFFNGTVDKFIGDAVMSVFGSPVKDERHLEQGVKAAVAVKEAVSRVNRIRQGRGLNALDIGIGLNSGTAIVGNMGSHMRMEYTAIGDMVNVASRLCGVAGGGEIVITETVYESVREHCTAEEMPSQELKGMGSPISLYGIQDVSAEWALEINSAVRMAIREYKLLDISGTWKKELDGTAAGEMDDEG